MAEPWMIGEPAHAGPEHAAARRFGHVTAIDISPAMLAVLRERCTAPTRASG